MLRLASWRLVALVLGGLAFVGMTATQLPPIVATHFGAGGVADGWMSRDGYTIFAMLLTVLLPLVVFASVGWLPYRCERFVNLPHRDVWLAPPHRAATLAWLRGFGVGLALLMALLAGGSMFVLLASQSLGALLIPVGLYALTISAMLWRALARLGEQHIPRNTAWLAALGATLFVLSDSLIGINRFVVAFDEARYAIMITYWLGQLGIAASAMQAGNSSKKT